jgi:excisionase family DNA binding protein
LESLDNFQYSTEETKFLPERRLAMTPEKAFATILKELRAELGAVPDRTLTFAEACEYLRMSEYTLRQLIRQKRIPHRVYGAEGSKNPRYLFSSRRLDQWIREEEERNYQRKAGDAS